MMSVLRKEVNEYRGRILERVETQREGQVRSVF